MNTSEERFVPTTISAEAAGIIEATEPDRLSGNSTEEWKAVFDATEDVFEEMNEQARVDYPATIEHRSIAGLDHLLLTPGSYDPANEDRLVVYVHGGAHVVSSPESMLIGSLPVAHHTRTKVLMVRYPLAWQEPHPASRDVVVAVYRELLDTYAPRRIAMAGDSAGGGLLMSAVLKLRDDGVAMPAVLGLLSPWADVTKTGDSLTLLAGADPTLDYEHNLTEPAHVYATGQELTDPSVSPLYADFDRGFPPSYISSGTRDLFLSHCCRLQRKLLDAGIENQLVVHEGLWHVFQVFPIPEAGVAWRDMAAFLERHWGR